MTLLIWGLKQSHSQKQKNNADYEELGGKTGKRSCLRHIQFCKMKSFWSDILFSQYTKQHWTAQWKELKWSIFVNKIMCFLTKINKSIFKNCLSENPRRDLAQKRSVVLSRQGKCDCSVSHIDFLQRPSSVQMFKTDLLRFYITVLSTIRWKR
jgi:hypothetical protein